MKGRECLVVAHVEAPRPRRNRCISIGFLFHSTLSSTFVFGIRLDRQFERRGTGPSRAGFLRRWPGAGLSFELLSAGKRSPIVKPIDWTIASALQSAVALEQYGSIIAFRNVKIQIATAALMCWAMSFVPSAVFPRVATVLCEVANYGIEGSAHHAWP